MKKNKLITISEYGKVSQEKLERKVGPGAIKLLKKINRLNKADVFKLTYDGVKATQYVGFVKVKKCTIQVIPKILDNDTDNVHFLIQLLKYTQKLNVKDQGISGLDKLKDDFFEILIFLFARNLREFLKKNFNKNYVFKEDNIPFLKGKLMLKENLRKNAVNQTKYYCRYDDFTEDNLMNQTFKFTASALFKATRFFANKRLLKDILFYLSEVSHKRITAADIQKIHLTRLNQEYEPILNLCKRFLENSSIEFRSSNLESFAFMFDMNKLFEEFVFRFIKKHRSKINIESYDSIEMVKGQFFIGKLFNEFNMQVDMLIKDKNDKRLLIDTKYKLLKKETNHQGISQSDMYQMFAYSASQSKVYEEVILLYPANKKIKENVKEITLKHYIPDKPTVKIHIRTIELSKIFDPAKKKIDESCMIEELNKALQVSNSVENL